MKREMVPGKKKSAEILITQQCSLMSKTPPEDVLLEYCILQAISEASVTSSKALGNMLYDTEVKGDPGPETAVLEESNKMCLTGSREFSSNMSGNGHQNPCCENQKLQFVEQIMAQISDLPLDRIDSPSTALRCQGMLLMEDLSQMEPSLWAREKLLSTCISSILALPSIKTLQSQDGENAHVQALYGQTVEAMEAMLQGLLSEKPNTAELFVLLEHLDPWMTSGQEHERARAVKTFVFLLKAAATDPKFQVSHDSPKLGVLIGQLCLHLNDPKKKIGQHAMEGIYYLYTLIQCQNDNGMKTKWLIAEQHKMFKEILGSYDSARPQQNIAQIIKEFEPHLTSRQMTEVLLTAIGCLKEANRNATAASHTITSVILEGYKHQLQQQVPEIVEKIYQQLGSIYQFQERQLVMGIMSHLAHPYMAEVCEALLQLPFPIDRFAAEMWYVLTKMCSDDELTVLVNILLKKLQLSPKSTGNYIIPLAAASAFSKLLSMPKCTDVALDIYPRLLMSLLVQVHYSIRHNIIRNADSQEEFEPVRHIVTALKTLLLAVKCCYEFAIFEREQGWEYLTSCKDHHRGVGLLARVMLQGCYYVDLLRILYLLVPFLERGDEEHQITATAFFIELLCMSEARRLPGQYSLHRLKRGLDNENPVIRALCIKGLVNMADWPGKEVKLLLPAMTKGLSGMDGRLFVESVTEIEKILAGPEGADCVCNITLSLQELFNDENESVRASAIYLFGRMVKLARKSNKHMIRPQVLENMVPLLLHLQEENPVVSKKCKNALEESFHFLGWKPPKQLICGKAWYEHEEVLDETCQYLVQKQEGNLKRFLYQGLFYTENELLSIKRASIMFLGFLILHMDSRAGMVDLDMIYHTLECLMHDPDASVSIAAAHAHDRVSAVLSKQQTRHTSNTGASNSASDKPTRNSRSHNSVRITSSSLSGVLSLWKSASRS